MASITQTVSQYNGGISQQPDEKKLPGQVIEAKNVLPDITKGLLKRPGSKLIGSLSDGTNNSQTNGRWFHYYIDETEQYIGQISRTGDVNIWRCSDGAEMTVVNDATTSAALVSYLTHTDDEDIQTLTLNDYTYVTNRTKTTSMTAAVETARPPEAFIQLKKVAYANQYSVNLFDDTTFQTITTATRIRIELVKSSNNYCHTDATLRTHTERLTDATRCGEDAGDNRDEYAPNVGTRIFSIDDGITLTDEGPSNPGSPYSYTIDVKASDGTSVNRGENLYFRTTTTGQSVVKSGATPSYQARYTTTNDLLYGGEGWLQGDYFNFWMKDGYYKCTIEEISTSKVQANLGLIRPEPTSFDTKTVVTAESIIGAIRSDIVATGAFADADVQQIGNGLYITRAASSFNLSTPVGELLNVLTDSIDDIADLPTQCKHGYVVKVANSEAEEDDYYLKFFGNNDRDGNGVWEECPKPGVTTTFDSATMPIQIVRQADGTFKVEQITWENRLVGDTVTVPEPSFIGKKINKMLFFRNRLVILSDENVIMSQPGEFFNFWSQSAIAFTATDNIDLSCSSEYPAVIYDGIQVNSGLVLFTKTQQFMLTTDSDVLSPLTAKINALSTYNFNSTTNPISLGTTIAFLDNAGKYSRLWEMSRVLREGEPDVINQTKLVSELFDKDVNKISNSRENGVIFFSKKGSNTLYGFKYFNASNQRLQQSWFTWEIVGTIQHHAILDDALYIVVRNNGKDTLQKYSIKTHTDSFTVTDDKNNVDATDDITYRIHLDGLSSVIIPADAYEEGENKTYFTKPNGYENTTTQLYLYDNNTTSDSVGKYTKADIVQNSIIVSGDWSNKTVILGYLYDMQVKLPTIYVTKVENDNMTADTNASLIIHRIKLNFGAHGSYSTTIDRLGKPSYTEVWESPISDQYLLSNVAIDDEATKTIPTYERNKNLSITLKSSHPSPATLYSMSWEGDYTSKFYSRV